MSDLAEAIDDVDELLAYANDYFRDKWSLDEKAERIKTHLRRVSEAEQVQWCETHDAWVPDLIEGVYADGCIRWGIGDKPCSIVPKLLVEGVGDEAF